jgi:homeobox protein cut-like
MSAAAEGPFTLAGASDALDFWRDFDLPSKRVALDNTCVDMREMKTASINGRKRLNEATKAFRTKTREEQTVGVTELLKLYQDEIDQLSNRSKYSEKAFYTLYKDLYEAPNPAAAIDGLIGLVTAGSTNTLEIERLKAELAQYDEEFQQLKNQDITIRRLEEQLQVRCCPDSLTHSSLAHGTLCPRPPSPHTLLRRPGVPRPDRGQGGGGGAQAHRGDRRPGSGPRRLV